MKTSMLLVLGMLGPIAFAENKTNDGAAQVKTLIESTVSKTIDVLKDKSNDRESRRTKIYALISPAVDWTLMGKLSLGRNHWAEFNPDEQKQFIELFSRMFKEFIFDKVQAYTNETAEFSEPNQEGPNKYNVPMTVLSKGERFKVLFKAYNSPSGWKVYDFELEGISMVRTYAAQYDQVLQKGSPKDLLAKLNTRAMAVPDKLDHAVPDSTDKKDGKKIN